MVAPFETSVVCPALIGRELQLVALTRLIGEAARSHGQVVLIGGEAGIGKSRLIAEARTQATSQGFALLQGRCFETDRLLPYAPLLDLLRWHLGAPSPAAIIDALGPLAPHLIGLLPKYATLLPQLALTPALEPEQERHRIAQAFVQFIAYQLARAGGRTQSPLIVVIEDLHWSDEASLEVLLALARRIATQPILLLLTYRNDEVQPVLADLIVRLDRERLVSELHLGPLDPSEVDLMLRAIFRQRRPIRSDFLMEVYALTEGNPFFIEEIVKSLVSTGEIFYAHGQWDRKPLNDLHIPRTVYVAVQRRVDLLSQDAQRVLKLAAMTGRRFNFELLQRLTEHNEAMLVELIRSLIAAQLVIEESAETFAFRHALTREALYVALLARERKALHGAIAEALEALVQQRGSGVGDVWVADLAYHCFAAEAWPKALEYARQAAERAVRLYAPRAAIDHLSHAIAAARHLELPPSSALYRSRGQMYETLGEFEHARDDYQAALAGALAASDRRTEWQALLDLGFLWAARDYIRMGEYRRRALALARALDDPVSLGHSLNRVGNWHLFVEQPREALRYHQEALEQFRAVDDRRGLAATYDLLAVTNMMGGDIPAGVAHYTRAVALFRELGDLQGLSSSLSFLSMRGASYVWIATVWPIVEAATCVCDGEEALRIARQIGWRAGEGAALACLALGYGPRGEYARALEGARTALAITQEIENAAWMVAAEIALGGVALDLLALTQARDHFERALALAHELGPFFVQNVAGHLALACVAQRDLSGAHSVLSSALAPNTPMETQGQRITWYARARLALAAGDSAGALKIVDRLIASAADVERYGAGCVPLLWHLQGDVLAVLGRSAEAEAALLAADQGAVQRGLRPMRWRIQASLGKLYQRQAHRKQAATAFAAARAIIADLATAIPDRDLGEPFLRSAAAQLPRPRVPTSHRVAKDGFDGLTEREREIAALIAQGRINREIADTLVIGERTVETHISNILSKLGSTSRRQIAAWAIQKGLAKGVA